MINLVPSALDADEGFHFAILGDRTGGANQEAFEQVVKDMVRLSPDFVVTVGDLVEDGRRADDWIQPLENMTRFHCPLYYTPGNHDIIDETSKTTYQQKTGQKPYYSFDHGTTHFIILNNAAAEKYDDMDVAQKTWLEDDLRSHQQAENIFIFMHKPFWAKCIADNEPDKMHQLFSDYHVDAVFTGHWHQYAYKNIDGIDYYIIGSSGADYGKQENIGLGSFYQFLWCFVDGEALKTTLIKSGNFFDHDHVLLEENLLLYRVHNELVSVSGRKVIGDSEKTVPMTIRIVNESEKLLEQAANLVVPDNWAVLQTSFDVSLESGETYTREFPMTQVGPFFPLPIFQFSYPFGRNKETTYEAPVLVERVLPVPPGKKKPVLDGIINDMEWEGALEVTEFCDKEGQRSRTDSSRILLLDRKKYLYIAALMSDSEMGSITVEHAQRDSTVYYDDSIGFLVSPNDDVIYQVYVNATGTIWDARIDLLKQEFSQEWNGKFEVKTSRTATSWSIEIKIPKKDLEITDSNFRINIRRKQMRNGESAYLTPGWGYERERYGILKLLQ